MRNVRMFIDDERNPKRENFDVVVRSADEAIRWMEKNGCPNYISFDHDLGDGKDAISIVHWMIEKDIDEKGNFIPKDFSFNVHSANPIGARNISSLLNKYLEFRENNYSVFAA